MTDDTDTFPDFPPTADLSYQDVALRLRQLEEWGWVSSDPSIEQATRDEVFRRVFPHGSHGSPWNDYHWVRSQHDRLAAEEFDLGQ